MNANDHVPMVNIMPFGFCKKGMPCMPVTPLAWVDVNKKHIIDGAPALTEDSKLACFHGGVITIVPLDAGSAEEGDRNENADSSVEKVALALGIIGGVLLNTNSALANNLKKMGGKKSIVKGVKGGVNKALVKDNGSISKNTENLRKWAKENEWVQQNTSGGVEQWGVKNVDGTFSWRLKLKPQASTREGLGAGSNRPRFDARLDDKGTYINPFTGETGGRSVGTHIPLGE